MDMPQSNLYYKELLCRFIKDDISPDEIKELYQFIEREPSEYKLLMQEEDVLELAGLMAERTDLKLSPEADLRIKADLLARAKRTSGGAITVPFRTRLLKNRWYRYAAAIIFVFGVVATILVSNKLFINNQDKTALTPVNDVPAPQSNKATITLANGQVVMLDSVGTGLLVQQGEVKVVKLADGQVVYEGITEAGMDVQYNTLNNPKGSKVIDLQLQDGSHVWLNAGSSITYPVVFTGNERKVNISGEAYFEISHNAQKPFYVSKENVAVKVLGTHFNMNAYDADIAVTLLEGSVQVTDEKSSVKIIPGEQALAAVNKSITVKKDVDLEQVMAWKNGFFNFNKADLKTVLKQIEYWYNVEIIYEGTIPSMHFVGEIQRDLNLSDVLDALKRTNVHFRIEGEKLIVMP